MKCEAIQNRLLALPDVKRVPDELRNHLTGCPACQAFAVAVGRLDALLAEIPVPSSEERKESFLTELTVDGPIITRIPQLQRRDSTANLRTVLARSGSWKYAAGLAAAVLVAIGWFAFSGKKTTELEAASVRYEPLGKEIAALNRLSKTDSPREKVAIWAELANTFRGEVRTLHKHATAEDMEALAKLFDKAARGGVLQQVQNLNTIPADQRKAILDNLILQMSEAEAEAKQLEQEAPQHAKPWLKKMATTAGDVRKRLQS